MTDAISGTIVNVDYNNKTFTIRTSEDQLCKCVCEFFCPVKVDDIIFAPVRLGMHGIYQVSSPPYVKICDDRLGIIQSLNNIFKSWKTTTANTIFDALAAETGSSTNVGLYLSEKAYRYDATKDKAIAETLARNINLDKAILILVWWQKNYNLRRLYLLGLNNQEIKACKLSPIDIYQKAVTNCYLFLPAIGLSKCADICQRLMKTPKEEDIFYGKVIRRIYSNLTTKSWTATPSKYLEREFPTLNHEHIKYLMEQGCLSTDFFSVYLADIHRIEKETSNYLLELLSKTPRKCEPELRMETLSEDQKKAIYGALNNTLSIITGGPGTGKTSILGELVYNFELMEASYLLCSFTGKAVSRIEEVVGKPAMTIHRFLNGGHLSDKNVYVKLDWVIIDEASMVTIELVNLLLNEIKLGQEEFPNIIIVGDINQLPPITWGYFLNECLKAKTIPVYYLTENHRTYKVEGEHDGIIANCRSLVNSCMEDPYELIITDNFFSVIGGIKEIEIILSVYHKNNYTVNDVTIVTPYTKYLDQLNTLYQGIYNKDKPSVMDSKGKIWHIGDRVMMTENDYDIGIMNGQEGIIVDFEDLESESKSKGRIIRRCLVVDFTKGKHSFPLEPLNDNPEGNNFTYEKTARLLAHSFALTVHKSQGSEWDFVIVYFGEEEKETSFLNKQLMQTALSRGKRALYCVGPKIIFENAGNRTPPFRCDNMSLRLNPNCNDVNDNNNYVNDMEGYNLPPDYDDIN